MDCIKIHTAHRRLNGITGKHTSFTLKLEHAGDALRARVQLFPGSLTCKDARFSGYDAACVVGVIEHLGTCPMLDGV